jgi:hypothetical protein
MPKQSLNRHELTREGLTTDGSFTTATRPVWGKSEDWRLRCMKTLIKDWNEDLIERRSEGSI